MLFKRQRAFASKPLYQTNLSHDAKFLFGVPSCPPKIRCKSSIDSNYNDLKIASFLLITSKVFNKKNLSIVYRILFFRTL